MVEMLDNVSIIHPGLEGLNLEDESVRVIQWHGFFSIILIGLLSVCGVVSTSGKVMIIHFILTKAPKRPLNKMILFDQVRIFIRMFSCMKIQVYNFVDWTTTDKCRIHSTNFGIPDHIDLSSRPDSQWLLHLLLPNSRAQQHVEHRRIYDGSVSHDVYQVPALDHHELVLLD